MYLAGNDLIVTLIAFGFGLWLAFRVLTGEDNTWAVVIGAFVLAVFGSSLPQMLSQNLLPILGVIGIGILGAQYLVEISLTESILVLLVGWLIGFMIIQVIMV